MTKKHFEYAAALIASYAVNSRDDAMHVMGMYHMAIKLGRTFNGRFDADRFNNACGETLTTAMELAS